MAKDLTFTGMEKIGEFYMFQGEHVVHVGKIDFAGADDATEQDVLEYLESQGIVRSELGVEGCPGRWFVSSVDCVYIDNIYQYALTEVHAKLDV